MREKFRQALLDIITGPFTATNYLLWRAYKEHLRNIDPDDLPKNVKPLFIELRNLYESRFNVALKGLTDAWDEAVLKSNGQGYSWWDSKGFQWWGGYSAGMSGRHWNNKERKPNNEEIYNMILNSDLMHGTQHSTAKAIKELLFFIFERMPKRSRNAKENKTARASGNKKLHRVPEEKVEF